MGQINEFKIVNNDNSKGLKFHYASGYGDSISINNISIPAAGQSSDNNFVRNFGGFSRIIRVDFVLFDDGTDKSTDASGKVTLTQQRRHLMDSTGVIQGNSTGVSSVTYTVTLYENGAAVTYTGGISDINVDFSGENSVQLNGSFNLIIGGA